MPRSNSARTSSPVSSTMIPRSRPRATVPTALSERKIASTEMGKVRVRSAPAVNALNVEP